MCLCVFSDCEDFIGEFQDKPNHDEASSTTTVQSLNPDELSKKMFEIVDDVNAVFQVILN